MKDNILYIQESRNILKKTLCLKINIRFVMEIGKDFNEKLTSVNSPQDSETQEGPWKSGR